MLRQKNPWGKVTYC